MTERYIIISRHELNSSDFLWHCFRMFARRIIPSRNDDLVMMWREDFDRLVEKANGTTVEHKIEISKVPTVQEGDSDR